MYHKFIPTYHAESIYDVDPSFFVKLGVHVLVLDLDNTLAAHNEEVPTPKTIKHLQNLKDVGLKLLVVSNNKRKRVTRYMKGLAIPFIFSARKPLTRRISRFLATEHAAKETVMMVGDQIFTDVFCANRLGVKILLTEKIVEKDQWTTKINRCLERPVRTKLRRKNKLKEWNANE